MRPVGSKYVLEEPLGRGATGTVWRGRSTGSPEAAGAAGDPAGQPGEAVAIKVLKEELAQDPDVVMRFLRERSVLLRLTDDNIVRTRDLVVEGELLALVMDLVEGPDLHRYLQEYGPFTPVGAALLTARVADALAAAHAKGVVHRDLKPANVLLEGADDSGRPMRPLLTDFGIARLADSPGVTRAHEFVGTPSYVAPESAQGQPQTSAVDIYGAGVLLYELVSGHPPFTGGSALEVLRRHLSEQPRRLDGLPGPLWTVIEHCLRKSPDERPSAASLARALRAVATGIGESATPEEQATAAGVAALLLPDQRPARVPGTGISPPGSAEPTQALPGGSAGGAAAATDVMPLPGGDQGIDATRAMGPQEPQVPEGPHPWESQMRAARDRNEPTQVQPMDPAGDPLQRAPQRSQRQPPRQPAPPQHQQPSRRPQRRSTAQERGYGQQRQPDHYPQQQPYAQPPAPQQRAQPRQAPEPPREPRRETHSRSRGANPMRIPGLGCLKGCLFVLIVLVVIAVLLWNFTPLPDWVADGRSFWETVTDWFGDVRARFE